MAKQKTLVIVAGPTAVGKTACAISLAQHFKTAIVSFDSRQCYRELSIGVARPSPAELLAVPHYFIATHSIHQPIDAAGFEQYALHILEQLFAHHNVVVAVGGTGLYLKALCEGLDAMPTIDPIIRLQLRKQYEKAGLGWLQQAILQEDPAFTATGGDINNPHRMLRALEVLRSSGQSIRQFQQQLPAKRPFTNIKIGLQLSKPELHERIRQRVLMMMKEGLLAEATTLFDLRHLQALQTVGYTEIFELLEGRITLAAATENIVTHTRQYAKRQLTWFKRDEAMHWFESHQLPEIIACVDSKVALSQTLNQK